jgi:hypothetical protein
MAMQASRQQATQRSGASLNPSSKGLRWYGLRRDVAGDCSAQGASYDQLGTNHFKRFCIGSIHAPAQETATRMTT